MDSGINTDLVYNAPERYQRIAESVQLQISRQIQSWRNFQLEAFLGLVTPRTRENSNRYPFWAMCSDKYFCYWDSLQKPMTFQQVESKLKQNWNSLRFRVKNMILKQLDSGQYVAFIELKNTIQPSYYLFNIDESKGNTYIPAYNFRHFDEFQKQMETKRKTIKVCQETKVETKPEQSLISKLMPRPSVSLKEFEKTKSVTTVEPELKPEMKPESKQDKEARELFEQIQEQNADDCLSDEPRSDDNSEDLQQLQLQKMEEQADKLKELLKQINKKKRILKKQKK